MLRAAVLLSFLRRVLRFPGLTARTGSTTGRPGALGACYVASWQLPRLNPHQLADDSFRAHQRLVSWRRTRHFALAICLATHTTGLFSVLSPLKWGRTVAQVTLLRGADDWENRAELSQVRQTRGK